MAFNLINKLFEYNYVPSRGQCFLTSADEQKTVNHHQLYFFNPDKNTNSTYKGNDDDLDSLMDFIDEEMGISTGKQQVNRKLGRVCFLVLYIRCSNTPSLILDVLHTFFKDQR